MCGFHAVTDFKLLMWFIVNFYPLLWCWHCVEVGHIAEFKSLKLEVVCCYETSATQPLLVHRASTKETGSTLKMTAFWHVALCSLVELDQRFRGANCLHSFSCWRRQYTPLKCWSASTRLQGATSQKAVIIMVATVRTWNLTEDLHKLYGALCPQLRFWCVTCCHVMYTLYKSRENIWEKDSYEITFQL
jgi:hypothetical protein